MVRVADVSDPAAVQAMMQSIRQEWGGIDILVNNAGILRDRSIGKMTVDEWRTVLDVDLSGVFYCCKFGLEILRDGGSIVCLGSLAAKMGFHGQSNYAAAKAGVQALTRVLARECAKRSIRVNAVAPGVIDTPMAAQITDAARSQLVKSIALQRLGRPQEVAEAVLFLCSPLAGYITGHVLEVDGGFLG
jgi:3-oxoacyl-[acyl-carrier protein] reductase